MPNPTSTVHCNFSCVLQIHTNQTLPDALIFRCTATIQFSPNNIPDGIDYYETLQVKVEYYNAFQETFLENAMVFCIGSLCIAEGKSATPDPTIHSHCLIRFVVILFHYCYNANLHFSAPGDPSQPSYPDLVHPATNPFLSFAGPVTYHHDPTPTISRMFGVDLTVFDKTVNSQSTFSTFCLLCIMPDNTRWKKFKLPKMGGYVQVSGEVIGFYEVKDRLSLCMLLTELNYLPLSLKPPSSTTNTIIPSSSTTSPETPRKRLRLRGEKSRTQQTPSKQPQQERDDTQPSSPDVIISRSPNTATTLDEDNGGNGSSTMGKGKRKKMPKVIRD